MVLSKLISPRGNSSVRTGRIRKSRYTSGRSCGDLVTMGLSPVRRLSQFTAVTFTSGRRIGTSAPLEIGSSSTFTSTRKAFPRFVGWSEWVQERFQKGKAETLEKASRELSPSEEGFPQVCWMERMGPGEVPEG